MAYADYDFYKNSYYGNVVPEADFPRLAERASGKIDSWTNDRLNDTSWLTDRQHTKVKEACCALAESIYYSDSLAKNAMKDISDKNAGNKVISSVSSGSESVSYATGGTSASSLEGQAALDMINDGVKTAKMYLSGIMYKDKGYSILFRGVGYE